MPTGYVLIFYWTVVAIGGALFLGTGAALLRYRRTGVFPGQPAPDRPPGDSPPPVSDVGHTPTRSETRRVLMRCVLGFGLAAWGATGLLTTG